MSQRAPILGRITNSFFRHRWLFLAALIAVSSLTSGVLYLKSKAYVATALTQVVTEDVATELGVTSSTPSYISPAQQNVNHFNDLVNDNLPGGFLDSAIQNAHLDKPINVDPKANDPRYALLKKNLSAGVQSDPTSGQSDSLWTISLTWPNPAESERIVAALQQQYIEAVGQGRSAQAHATGRFLDSQIADYETRMRKAEQALIDYKKQNSGELPKSQSADISQLSNLKAELDNLQITARDNSLRKAELQKRIAEIKPLSILEQTSTDSPYALQIKALMAKRDALLAGNKLPTHPDVVALTEQIDTLEKGLASKQKAHSPETDTVMQTKLQDNPEYQALQQQLTDATIAEQTQTAQIAHLQQAIAQYETRIAAIPAEQRTLTDKTRDYSILKEQYENLLQRREQIKIKGDLDKVSASSTLTPIGQVYAEPTTGKAKLLGLIFASIVLGAIVGIILVVLSEWADHSLRYESDAARLLGVPVLASLPETAALRYHSAPTALTHSGGQPALSAPQGDPAP